MGTHHKTVKSRFKQTWKCKTTCPKVDVVYKIIVMEENHQQNRYGRIPVISDLVMVYHLLAVEMARKLEEILWPWASHAETKLEDGMERKGNITSETQEIRSSVPT